MNAVLGSTLVIGATFIALNLLTDAALPRVRSSCSLTWRDLPDAIARRARDHEFRTECLTQGRSYELARVASDRHARVAETGRARPRVPALCVESAQHARAGDSAAAHRGRGDRADRARARVAGGAGAGRAQRGHALSIIAWPPYARLARAESLRLAQADYIHAARLAGASHWRVLLRYIVPLCSVGDRARAARHGGHILAVAGLGLSRTRRAAA